VPSTELAVKRGDYMPERLLQVLLRNRLVWIEAKSLAGRKQMLRRTRTPPAHFAIVLTGFLEIFF
jgi:hypothetical protein